MNTLKEMNLYEIIDAFPSDVIIGKLGDTDRSDYVYFEITSCKKGVKSSDGNYTYNIEINFKGKDDDMDYQYLFFDKSEALKFAKENNWTDMKLQIS